MLFFQNAKKLNNQFIVNVLGWHMGFFKFDIKY